MIKPMKPEVEALSPRHGPMGHSPKGNEMSRLEPKTQIHGLDMSSWVMESKAKARPGKMLNLDNIS